MTRSGILTGRFALPTLAVLCLLVAGVAPVRAHAAHASKVRLASARSAARPPASSKTGASDRSTPEWATWITRDVEINFQNLPKTYSCDALWYKLRGVLLAIGARQYMSIMPYDCGKGAAHDGRWPTVDLRFQTLRILTGASAKWAETKAVRKAVELGPGLTQRLEPGDCNFLAQLQGTLFAYLKLQVVTQHLECGADGNARYGLTVQALIEHPLHASKS